MEPPAQFVDYLRSRILNYVHLRGAVAGHRLPGIRALARETGVDHRVIARTYRLLENEGLVVVRGRSGVFLDAPAPDELRLPPGTAHWLSSVLESARQRRIPLPELARLLQPVVAGVQIRCACVESNEDQMVAYEWELEHNYGLTISRVFVSPGTSSPHDTEVVRKALLGVSLVVTTGFHAGVVSPIAEELGVPAVILAIDATAVNDIAKVLERRIQQGPLTVIIADRQFAVRLRAMAEGIVNRDDDIRYILAEDSAAIEQLDPADPVVITRAARNFLGEVTLPIFLFHAPILAPATIRTICEHIVRARLDSLGLKDVPR